MGCVTAYLTSSMKTSSELFESGRCTSNPRVSSTLPSMVWSGEL